MTPTPEELDALEARLRDHDWQLSHQAADAIKALRADATRRKKEFDDLREAAAELREELRAAKIKLHTRDADHDALRLSLREQHQNQLDLIEQRDEVAASLEAARGEIANRDLLIKAALGAKELLASDLDAAHAKLAGAEKDAERLARLRLLWPLTIADCERNIDDWAKHDAAVKAECLAALVEGGAK